MIINDFLDAGIDSGDGEGQCFVYGCDAVRVQHSNFCRSHLVRSRIIDIGFPLAFRYAAERHLATLSERELAFGRENYNRQA
jgi:hypothetical protein